MFDEYRYIDPSSKTTQDLVQYLADQKEAELLTVVMDMLKHMALQSGELAVLRPTVREE